MKVMLLIAHGSRSQAANEEILRLADRIRQLDGQDFDAVVPAFLEFAEPDIHSGVERCVELGAESIVAVPYFLAAGKHVSVDIPAEIASAREDNPGVRIVISQYLGDNDAMTELVLQSSRIVG